ncbi:endospore germination permease [Paenibacillus sp. GCM10012307]|uniref:Endospore germination permease n=1 Tax=Paenibacillus roseus TaxID=2798579 RepID=A0A934IY89_9BACL|nr:endospore germination permease [Paenibacillus roseus]MBJ6361456.1 endospore germination permease [Paenibacillus roseus]
MKSKQESVSSFQMASLLLTFTTGSSVIFIPGQITNAAKNGAWISILISYLLGVMILAILIYLYKRAPELSWVGFMRKTAGPWVTSLLLIPLTFVIFWQLAAIVIEIGGFFKSTMMKDTPNSIIQGLFFLTVALTARAGIEVMARMFLLLLIFMYIFVMAVLLLASPLFHGEYLLPVIPDGFKPILYGAYISYGFPYAEIALFSLLLPFTRRKESGRLTKYLHLALFINCLTLVFSILCTIMVLGPMSGHLNYSLFQLARLISIQDILERVESVIGFSLIIGVYMKAAIVLFMITTLLSDWFNIKDSRLLTYPVALIGLLLSVSMYPDEITFFVDGYTMWTLIDHTAYVMPLLIIFVVALFRRKKGGTSSPTAASSSQNGKP